MSNFQSYIHYSINGVPLLTYGLIGITTIVLATVTLYESNNDETEIDIVPQTMVSQLPSIQSFNPFVSKEADTTESLGQEEEEEEKPEEQEQGEEPEPEETPEENVNEETEKKGLFGGKKRKTKTIKRKNKKSKQNKTKHHK